MTDTPPELIVELEVTKRWPLGALELRKARQQRRIGFGVAVAEGVNRVVSR